MGPVVKSRAGAFVAALILLWVAGCSGAAGEGEQADNTSGVQAPGETSGVQAPGEFSIRGALEQLPRPSDDSYPITVGDLAAGARALDLAPPTTAEERGTWLNALGVADSETPVTFLLPRDLTSEFAMGEEPELGFDLSQVSWWAEAGLTPDAQLFTGDFDEATLSPDLVELGEGLHSAGEGEDGSTDVEGRTLLRPLGQPLRVGQQGDQILLSNHTRTVENWLSGQGPSLATEERVLETADRLDAAGAVSGYFLVQPGGGAGLDPLGAAGSPEEAKQRLAELEEWAISIPFGVVAVGTAVDESTPRDLAVYHFGSESTAAEALEQVERAWTEGVLQDGSPVAERFTPTDVSAHGPTVVVTLERAEARSDTLVQILLQRDGPLNYL